jgi:hypothetical protein
MKYQVREPATSFGAVRVGGERTPRQRGRPGPQPVRRVPARDPQLADEVLAGRADRGGLLAPPLRGAHAEGDLLRRVVAEVRLLPARLAGMGLVVPCSWQHPGPMHLASDIAQDTALGGQAGTSARSRRNERPIVAATPAMSSAAAASSSSSLFANAVPTLAASTRRCASMRVDVHIVSSSWRKDSS